MRDPVYLDRALRWHHDQNATDHALKLYIGDRSSTFRIVCDVDFCMLLEMVRIEIACELAVVRKPDQLRFCPVDVYYALLGPQQSSWADREKLKSGRE